MKTLTRLSFVLIGFLTLIPIPLPAEVSLQPVPLPTPSRWERLFSITRTTNKNEVVYELGLNSSLGIFLSNPARVYWILHEKNGILEGLNALELLSAYGFSIQKASDSQLDLLIRGLPEVPVHVRKLEGKGYGAIAVLNQKEVVVKHIFLQVTEGGILPKVTHATFKGFFFQDGKPVEIKLPAKKLSKSRYDD